MSATLLTRSGYPRRPSREGMRTASVQTGCQLFLQLHPRRRDRKAELWLGEAFQQRGRLPTVDNAGRYLLLAASFWNRLHVQPTLSPATKSCSHGRSSDEARSNWTLIKPSAALIDSLVLGDGGSHQRAENLAPCCAPPKTFTLSETSEKVGTASSNAGNDAGINRTNFD